MNDPEKAILGAPSSRRTRQGFSKAFVMGILAAGVLLGFMLGWLALDHKGPGGGSSLSLYDEGLVTSIFERASPAVVEINVTLRAGGSALQGTGTGSGFLVDREGHIVTNHHVVDGAEQIRVTLADGRTLTASKLGTSPADDLALLQVDADKIAGVAPLPLANSDKVKPGQMAIALGSPFRQFNSVTVGVVSGTGRGPASVLLRPIPGMIQTDAPLNPGNSGGPLLNSRGEVIGVNSAVRTGSDQRLEDFRIGFAVPTNTLKGLFPELLIAQQVRRPWLGISGGSVTDGPTDLQVLPKGVYVFSVFPGSPAEKVGLVPFGRQGGSSQGDVITAIDGEPVASVEEMVGYLNRFKPGHKVTLSVYRNQRTIQVGVTLAEWPET